MTWFSPWDKVLEYDFAKPEIKWFAGGKLNVAYNCLDRHLTDCRRNKAAIIWQGEKDEEVRTYTYQMLHDEVCRFANVLKKLGVKKGDRVGLYLPMVPELAIAMLACARIGAPHSIIFAGFSAHSLRDRINDCEAKVLVCSDAVIRSGKTIPLKPNADAALSECASIEKCVVLRHAGNEVDMLPGRDVWWHDVMAERDVEGPCPAEPMDAEDVLFILYTSGSTGKPKGVYHTTGGYLTYAAHTSQIVFDLHDDDIHWCTADIGWITGHSYIVYGPLALGATSLMFESVPTYPAPDRFWQICQKFKVNIFYTAPTVIPVAYEIRPGLDPEARPVLVAHPRLRGRAHQSRSLDLVPRPHRQGETADRRHLVADRDGRAHDFALALRHDPQARFGHVAAARYRCRHRWTRTTRKSAPTRAVSCSSASPGPACCAASGTRPSGSSSSISPVSRAATNQATAPAATRTVIFGSWAGWMT